jgi:hypothetical protein
LLLTDQHDNSAGHFNNKKQSVVQDTLFAYAVEPMCCSISQVLHQNSLRILSYAFFQTLTDMHIISGIPSTVAWGNFTATRGAIRQQVFGEFCCSQFCSVLFLILKSSDKLRCKRGRLSSIIHCK